MAYSFEVAGQVSAPPPEVFDAWMSSEGHSAMTGGEAHVDPHVGGRYDAWNDYIHGVTVTLEPPHRVVQTWRSANFAADDEDSQIEVTFAANEAGTIVTVRHSNVPDGDLGYENGGWQQSYFTPMQAYFAAH
jgi:uncharacterized protein YndB with AHSA1/START domain